MPKIKTLLIIMPLLLLVCLANLAAVTSYQTHKVKRGESLYSISKDYGVTINELKKLNGLTGSRINVGQELKVKPLKETAKKSSPEVQSSDGYQIHKVKRGENLFKISRDYGITIQDIKDLNNLKSSNLAIGQELKIKLLETTPPPKQKEEKQPEKKKPAVTTKSVTSDTTQVVERLPVSPDELPDEYFYTVQPRDNLYRISVNSGITYQEILKFNDLTEDNTTIHPGQRIIIKDPASYQTPEVEQEEQEETVEENPPGEEETSETPNEADSVLIEKVYIVQRKDNLYRIAKNNNMTVEELKKLNNLKSNNIKVGQRLYIVAPKGAATAANHEKIITEADLKTKAKIRTDLIMPVEGKVLSEYGIRNGRPHKGIDLGAPSGMPVYAVLDGTVVYSGPQGNYGNVVVIEHPDFVMTVYAHNEKNLVSVGEVVKQGQVIATVGSTGNATAPHVHFEYRIKGKAINPRKVLPLN